MWIKLIISEFKKIFKIKMNVILLIIAIFGTSAFVAIKYYDFMSIFEDEDVAQNEQGEVINGIDYLKYIDTIRHKYADEWSEEKANKMLKDFNQLMEKYSTDEIDELVMEMQYGFYYKDILEPMLNNELTHKQYHEYKLANGMEDSDYEEELADEVIELEIYRKQNPIKQAIQSAYGNPYLYADYPTGELSPMIENLNSLLIEKKVFINKDELLEKGVSPNNTKLLEEYINTKAQSIPSYYDSTVSNDILIHSFTQYLWIPLVCIMIILANTFGIERQYRVDQIIHPTKTGIFKIAVSKIIMGTVLSFVTMFLAIALSYLAGNIIIPFHEWNIASFDFRIIVPDRSLIFNFKDILMNAIMLSLSASLAITSITLGLSYILKNKFAVIIILFLFIATGIFFQDSNFYHFVHPYTMLNIRAYDYLYGLPFLFLNGKVTSYIIIAIVFWITITVIIYIFIIVISRMRCARNVS